jgi:hypothetical protein
VTGAVQQQFHTDLNSALFASRPTSWPGPTERSHRLRRGISNSFNFVPRASDSVRHSFNFVFDRIRSVMASADENAVQLPADTALRTPPSRVVTRGAFRGIPAREGPGRLVSRDELRKLAEHGRAPQPVHNPAQPGRITARIRVMRSQANIISSFD